MSESFLGVTAPSFLRKSHWRFTATLVVRKFPQPHTADRVLEVLKAVLQWSRNQGGSGDWHPPKIWQDT